MSSRCMYSTPEASRSFREGVSDGTPLAGGGRGRGGLESKATGVPLKFNRLIGRIFFLGGGNMIVCCIKSVHEQKFHTINCKRLVLASSIITTGVCGKCNHFHVIREI